MTFPASDVNTTNADAGTDVPASFRTDVLDLITKFNQLRNHISTFVQGFLSAASAAAARTTLGSTTVGDALFVAASADAAAKVLGVKEVVFLNTLSNSSFSSASFANPDTSTTAAVDTGSAWASGVFTVPRTGYVRVQIGQAACSQFSGTVNYVELRVKVNSTAQNPSHYAYPHAGKTDSAAMNVILAVTAADTVQLVAKVDGGGTASLTLSGVTVEML